MMRPIAVLALGCAAVLALVSLAAQAVACCG